MTRITFSLDECQKKSGHAYKVCDAPNQLLENMFIRLGFMMYKRIEAFLDRTGCVSVVAHLFMRKILHFATDNNPTDVI